MRALLDVNVLVALLDADHVHHSAASDWLREHGEPGWASCPITQNGFLRVVSQPRYPSPIAPRHAAELLRRATATPHHAFWVDDLSLLDVRTFDLEKVHGPRQLTDTYLLGLALRNEGRFVTFDRSISGLGLRGMTRDCLVRI